MIRGDRGFGFSELLASLTVLSVVMLGAYKVTMGVSRTTYRTTNAAELSRDSVALKRKLDKMLANIGYNPKLTTYVTIDGTDPTERSKRRMGINYINGNKVLFTSDDNELTNSACANSAHAVCAAGEIQNSERYGLWIADDNSTNLADMSTRIFDRSAEPCAAANTAAPQTFRLWGLVKDCDPTDVNCVTTPQVLAQNVLCFEARYFVSLRGSTSFPSAPAWADADPLYPFMERLWNNPAAEYPPSTQFPADVANFKPPTAPTDQPEGGTFINPLFGSARNIDEEAYYNFISNTIDKIQIGIVIQSSIGRQNSDTAAERTLERIIVEKPINNVPFKGVRLVNLVDP